MITYDYTECGGNYFFNIYLGNALLFQGAGYYEQMLQVVQEFKTQYKV